MAAVWGMEKFHYFLYGRHFEREPYYSRSVAKFNGAKFFTRYGG